MQFLRTVADELVRSESKHTKSDRVVASRTLPHWEEHEEPEVTMIEEVEPINAAPAVSLAIDDFISDSCDCRRRPRRKKGPLWLIRMDVGTSREHSTSKLRKVHQRMEVGHCDATRHMTTLPLKVELEVNI